MLNCYVCNFSLALLFYNNISLIYLLYISLAVKTPWRFPCFDNYFTIFYNLSHHQGGTGRTFTVPPQRSIISSLPPTNLTDSFWHHFPVAWTTSKEIRWCKICAIIKVIHNFICSIKAFRASKIYFKLFFFFSSFWKWCTSKMKLVEILAWRLSLFKKNYICFHVCCLYVKYVNNCWPS